MSSPTPPVEKDPGSSPFPSTEDSAFPESYTSHTYTSSPTDLKLDLGFNPLSNFEEFLDTDYQHSLQSRPIRPLPTSARKTTSTVSSGARVTYDQLSTGDGFMSGKKRMTLDSSPEVPSGAISAKSASASITELDENSSLFEAGQTKAEGNGRLLSMFEEDEEEKKRGGPRFLEGTGAQCYSFQVGGGYDDHDCDDSFTMPTSLPKKRKIPVNSAILASDQPLHDNPQNRTSTSTPSDTISPEDDVESYLPSPSTAPNIHGAYYFDFPSFPYLPRGYTRQIPQLPPKIRTNLQIVRLSPACRANMWAKTVWSQRRKILALALGVEGIDADGMPIPSEEPMTLTKAEERAVEYSGVVWGKVFDAPSLVKGGKDGLKKGEDGKRKKQEKLEQASSGMNGIKEILTKDGLSITSIVREEVVWLGKKSKPILELANSKFTYQCESAATTFLYNINQNLVSLRKRLTTLITRSKLFTSKGKKGSRVNRSTKRPGSTTTSRSLKPALSSASTLSKEQKLLSANDPNLLAEFRINVATHTVTETFNSNDRSALARKGGPTRANLMNKTISGAPTAVVKATSPEILASKSREAFTLGGGFQASDNSPSAIGAGSPPASTKKKPGKKKRSALANAGNPHHMKNYVPTRLVSDQTVNHVSGNAPFMSSLLFPTSSRFLAAKPNRYRSSAYMTDEAASEEYICIFCDYSLFYGSTEASKKAVAKRKKTLARRRRAKERASGVANGLAKKSVERVHDDDEDDWDCDEELLPNGQYDVLSAEQESYGYRIERRKRKTETDH
ncbi:trna guanine-n1-methyltransferase [Phaffia rhodozyma]|uniref:Trna guanine-n1-methyltransferase n=1 Tax=Phaffia rhodozyma TaxID=264483 RepID=A0A0F7SHD6_PHARH|nr:trna guanine-n1-methyltransferase [Phaffia rhodozyma]